MHIIIVYLNENMVHSAETKNYDALLLYENTHTRTHIRTHTRVYIYIYREREREEDSI